MHPTRTSVNDNIILIYKNVSSLHREQTYRTCFKLGLATLYGQRFVTIILMQDIV